MTAIPSKIRSRLGDEDALWLEDWLSDPFHESILPRLHFLLAGGHEDEVVDSFSKRLSVGTGGMRGPVGLGPNRFNHETLGRAIQGHATFLRQRNPELFAGGAEPPVLVIAYDVRRFHDKRGTYAGADLQDPLTGVSSRDFALFAAFGYGTNGIRTLIPDEGEPYVSTPELSLAIRRGGHLGGINLSASHNHPDDNGLKFYNASGGQLSGDESDALQESIFTVDLPDPPDEDQRAAATELIGHYDPEVHEAYIALATAGLEPRDGATILYDCLEGTGADSIADALEVVCPGYHLLGDAGDGGFDSVPYGLPNPEITAVFEPALALAEERGFTLLLASDPDADRLGAKVRAVDGEWHDLTGNQLGAIQLEWLCQRLGAAAAGRALIQTCVTGEETVRIAESHGLAITSDLPVGFKFIARAIDEMQALGHPLLFAFEESLGYLRTAELREKDATGAATLLADAHLQLTAAGSSVHEFYGELNARHGHYRSGTRSLVMTGPEGVAFQERLIDELRAGGGIAGSTLRLTRDYSRSPCTLFDLSAPGDRGSLNVLELRGQVAGAETRLSIRRSGTEPKIKLYFDVHGDPSVPLRNVTFETLRSILAPMDTAYTRVCHVLPDHIPLAEKLDFEKKIAPQVLDTLLAPDTNQRSTELGHFLRHFAGGSLHPLAEALGCLAPSSIDPLQLKGYVDSLG